MDHLRVVVKLKSIFSIFLLVLCFTECTKVSSVEYATDGVRYSSSFKYDIVPLHQSRERREVPTTPASPVPSSTIATPVPAHDPTQAAVANTTEDSNRTTNGTEKATPLPVTVTQTPPLLGVNGTGQLRINITTTNTPKVSDPIVADDNLTDVFKETPERIKSEQNITNLTYDKHNFYNSSFIGNKTYFNEYWANITKTEPQIHSVLSNSHRRATTIQLTFDFPFYGHSIRNITVATGGFIYTGEHVHNWLAATQYIAPLMANFDTTVTNDSVVKLYDDGEKFSAFWENVTLQEDPTKKFTFAVTLYKNGDIIFAYKDIPIDVQEVNDTEHPVKVGISDAYLTDKIIFYVRRKTIYEYHRVSFINYVIANNTILKLHALPTCLQYKTCESCVNHDTGFNCSWCPQIHKCSSGTDRNKQDWLLRSCDRTTIMNASACAPTAVVSHEDGTAAAGSNTAYNTDTGPSNNNTEIKIAPKIAAQADSGINTAAVASQMNQEAKPVENRSPVGGVVSGLVAVMLVICLAVWVLYAFKNPHTRSGQLLIKYRPSQWNWRRGEARYTAATIHM